MTARRVVTGLALAIFAVLGWVLLAPQQLGGPVAVVSTYGDSMLPTFTASDLVVVVEASDYDVGDVVAYRSSELGAVVLHRIVEVAEDGYVTSGDNNDWLDPDRPTDDDIMGRARLRVPGAGRLLELPAPVRAAAITGLGLMALVGGRAATRRRVRRPRSSTPAVQLLPAARRRRATRRPRRSGDAADRRRGFAWVGWPSQVALAAGGVAMLAMILGVMAFTQSTVRPGEVDYGHRGEFAYASDAPRGLVYPDGQVTTGDPVFLALVDTLELSFDYAFDGPGEVEPGGQLWMEISHASGWSSRSPFGDERTASDGEPLRLEGRLDVPQLRRTLQRIQEEIGGDPADGAGTATITVTAEIDVTGTVSGEPMSDRFTPELVMELGERRLVLQVDAAGTEGTDTDDAGTAEAIVRTQEGSVTVAGIEPARLEFAGRGIDVWTARPIAVVLFGAALLALAVAALGAAQRGDLGEAGRIRARYGGRIIEIEAMETPGGYGLVDVRDIETLVDLADRVERPVLHQQSSAGDTYLVEGDATVYRFRT